MTPGSWHYGREGEWIGPFRLIDLEQLAAAGIVTWETRLRDSDAHEMSLQDVLTSVSRSNDTLQTPRLFASAGDAGVPPEFPPPPPLPQVFPPPPKLTSQTPSLPWNPLAVAVLGILFSPLWAGIMAGLNARRLDRAAPMRRPIATGVGSAAFALLVVLFWTDSTIALLAIYAGALAVIWEKDLQPQRKAFAQRTEGGDVTHWIIPCLAGIPGALGVLVTFFVWPLLPPSPRAVCDHFLEATSAVGMKTWTMPELWPAVEALAAVADRKEASDPWGECFGEEPSRDVAGGYLVGYRLRSRKKSHAEVAQVVFELTRSSAGWKIDDVIYIAIEGVTLPTPVRLSASSYDLFAVAGTAIPASARTDGNGLEKNRKVEQAWIVTEMKSFLTPPYVRRLGIFLLVSIGLHVWRKR